MTTLAFFLNELTPTETLEVLAATGQELLPLWREGTGLWVSPDSILGLRVRLVVPKTKGLDQEKAFAKLSEVLKQKKGVENKESKPIENVPLTPLD